MMYAIGPISGCHINPAVTVGAAVAGRVKGKDVVPYISAQILGAICGFGFIALILQGRDEHPDRGDRRLVRQCSGTRRRGSRVERLPRSFGHRRADGRSIHHGAHLDVRPRPHRAWCDGDRRAERVCGASHRLGARVTNLVAIPITNASINPARSIAPAIYAGDWAYRSYGSSCSRPCSAASSRPSSTRLLQRARPPADGL